MPRAQDAVIPKTFETVIYKEENGVAWITLNRPEKMNSFNQTMMDEMQAIWAGLRNSKTVRCVVLTAAGERAFCTGVDRDIFNDTSGFDSNKAYYDDFSRSLGPRSNEMWIPVIAAVRGISCGGAFYMLGEVDFIIAADDATFFDPHVTTGITPVYEAIHMLQKMPFQEIMRLSLLGSYERLSAKRAHEIGLVSEVVPGNELLERARWAAETIASQPAIATQGTVRTLWAARSMGRFEALAAGPFMIKNFDDADSAAEGQKIFASKKRIDWRLR